MPGLRLLVVGTAGLVVVKTLVSNDGWWQADVDDDGKITLTELDEGRIYVAHRDGGWRVRPVGHDTVDFETLLVLGRDAGDAERAETALVVDLLDRAAAARGAL